MLNFRNLIVLTIINFSLFGCSAKSLDIKETLKQGNGGAISMLLIDSDVYRVSTDIELNKTSRTLLRTTLSKLEVIRKFEQEIGGGYKIEDDLLPAKINQLCLINNFMLTHRKELPPNIDFSDTYNWINDKQIVYKKTLTEYLGDKKLTNDCRS
ncbi:hypothetical protein [Acinetobacter sp. NIPH 2699]|uniref:hypothetical protein n=1 Tax=Acinetobacter sp. NIPH 2699 TaxID=2923433 RepID=UPI001F4B41BF|nr:hypothetical protein [Acinetobacter sp. NIPH 2699]MCH7336960.1 hypothetical protein [Acinetobacter sp. NIPH 2699]